MRIGTGANDAALGTGAHRAKQRNGIGGVAVVGPDDLQAFRALEIEGFWRGGHE